MYGGGGEGCRVRVDEKIRGKGGGEKGREKGEIDKREERRKELNEDEKGEGRG